MQLSQLLCILSNNSPNPAGNASLSSGNKGEILKKTWVLRKKLAGQRDTQSWVTRVCMCHTENENEKCIYMWKDWAGVNDFVIDNNYFGWSSWETFSSAYPFLRLTLSLHSSVPCGAVWNISKWKRQVSEAVLEKPERRSSTAKSLLIIFCLYLNMSARDCSEPEAHNGPAKPEEGIACRTCLPAHRE